MPKNTQTTQKQNNQNYQRQLAEWRNSLTYNKDGLSLGDVKQTFILNSEPTANISIQSFGNPVTLKKSDAKPCLFWRSGSDTNGIIAIATYTNLKNSSFTDANGQTHHIAKIIRTFSNLTQAESKYSEDFARWAISVSWGLPESYGVGFSGLQISRDPAHGATFTNASGISVQDEYYDEQGNRIDPIGGFYVFSSLNYGTANTGNGYVDIESVNGTGIQMKAVAGSTINVQPDGRLEASSGNDPEDLGYDWDNNDSPNFYMGSGVGYITNENPTMRFQVRANGSDKCINAFWFTINTNLPSVPVTLKTTEVHYHYDTKSVKILMPEVLIYGHFRHYLHVL